MIRIGLFLAVTLAAPPAFAAATDWQEIATGARVRLVYSGGQDPRAGVELQLPAGSNTYWRIPGDSGIPTTIDLSGSVGVQDTDVIWPYPRIEEAGGYRDFVYRGDVVVPIRLAAASGAILDARVMLGVCSDVCVPAQAHLRLALDGSADAAQAIRLDQAVADAPADWTGPAEPFGAVKLSADGHSLEIGSPDPAIDPESLIADTGDPAILFTAPQKSPDGAIWTLELLGGGDMTELLGKRVRLTFTTPLGAFSELRTVASAER